MALFSHGGLKLSYENSDLECISFSSLLILTKEKICWVNESPFSLSLFYMVDLVHVECLL